MNLVSQEAPLAYFCRQNTITQIPFSHVSIFPSHDNDDSLQQPPINFQRHFQPPYPHRLDPARILQLFSHYNSMEKVVFSDPGQENYPSGAPAKFLKESYSPLR